MNCLIKTLQMEFNKEKKILKEKKISFEISQTSEKQYNSLLT